MISHAIGAINRLYTAFPGLSMFFSYRAKVLDMLRIWHLLSRNGVTGDYCEFGVYKGDTFKLAMRAAQGSYRSAKTQPTHRFLAFDSFRGLPDEASLQEDSNIFKAGEYTCDRQTFEKNIRRYYKSCHIEIVEGWFEESLTAQTRQQLKLEKIAIANIDCDLYGSTKTCLEFITPALQTGSILIFDDWLLMGGSMQAGEAKATSWWIRENPEIQLIPFGDFGYWGKTFIVNISKESSPFYLRKV